MDKQPYISPSIWKAMERRWSLGEPDVQAAVCCDMSKDGELRHIYLFLSGDRLLLGVADRSGEMTYAGAPPFRSREPEGIREWYAYALDSLSHPRILNQVVGGLLSVEMDGSETWLCRFSGPKCGKCSVLSGYWTRLYRTSPFRGTTSRRRNTVPNAGLLIRSADGPYVRNAWKRGRCLSGFFPISRSIRAGWR